MTKSWIRRTGSGFEAIAARVTRPGTGKPNVIRERCGVDPTGLREEDKPYLRRSLLWSAHPGLPLGQPGGTGVEKSAEAIVAPPGEGPNLGLQGADRWIHGRIQPTTASHPPGWAWAIPQGCGGTAPLRKVEAFAVRGVPPQSGLGGVCRFHQSKKPPYTTKYVRWCGRTGS